MMMHAEQYMLAAESAQNILQSNPYLPPQQLAFHNPMGTMAMPMPMMPMNQMYGIPTVVSNDNNNNNRYSPQNSQYKKKAKYHQHKQLRPQKTHYSPIGKTAVMCLHEYASKVSKQGVAGRRRKK